MSLAPIVLVFRKISEHLGNKKKLSKDQVTLNWFGSELGFHRSIIQYKEDIRTLTWRPNASNHEENKTESKFDTRLQANHMETFQFNSIYH